MLWLRQQVAFISGGGMSMDDKICEQWVGGLLTVLTVVFCSCQILLVAATSPLLISHLRVRRVSPVRAAQEPWWLGGDGDLLLRFVVSTSLQELKSVATTSSLLPHNQHLHHRHSSVMFGDWNCCIITFKRNAIL